MAILEHLTLLRTGTFTRNEWRKKNPQIELDLSSANLSGYNLISANLQGVNLSHVNLENAL